MACIEARGLRKTFGKTGALNGIDLTVPEGRIVGVIGANGAGKTTLLNCILGLISCDGELRVLERDPWQERARLMGDVAFLTDIAVLPRWIRVAQLLDYVAGVHPRFNRAKAETFLARTNIVLDRKVKEMSKGMVVQLHLALVMAIDARLLVLDEPTLGLDILYAKKFYDSLLADFFDDSRTIVLATHQIDDVQHVLTDVVILQAGRVILHASTDELEARYRQVKVRPDQLAGARALRPLHEQRMLDGALLLYDGVDRAQLTAFGEVRTPTIAEIFMGLSDRS
jgi:ABC-2 type transport system ATP-binding protein